MCVGYTGLDADGGRGCQRQRPGGGARDWAVQCLVAASDRESRVLAWSRGRRGGLGESKKLGNVSVVQVCSPTIISIKIQHSFMTCLAAKPAWIGST